MPLLVAVMGGFKTNQDLQSHPGRWPSPFILSNYTDIISTWPFWQKTMNSVIVMLLTTVIVLSLSSAAAFVFSRMQFRGRETLFNFFVLGLLFPLPVAILPLYLLLRSLNLTDSLWGVILPQVAFGLPFNILLLRTFFVGGAAGPGRRRLCGRRHADPVPAGAFCCHWSGRRWRRWR